jgi:hypothetical protein
VVNILPLPAPPFHRAAPTRSSFKGFAAAAEVNTGVIEACQQLVMAILTGTAKQAPGV